MPHALYQPPTADEAGTAGAGSAVAVAAPPTTVSAMAPLVSIVSAPPTAVSPITAPEASSPQVVSIVPMPTAEERNGKDGKRKKKHGKH